MTDFKETTPEIQQAMDDAQDLRRKQLEIQKDSVEQRYEDLQHRKKENKKNASINLALMSKETINDIVRESDEYLEHAKDSMCFINDDFQGLVPFFGRNIILAGAITGSGKTTIGKNLAYLTIMQGGRVLYLTNEENRSDVYNGLSCLHQGWSYTNHKHFSVAQREYFKKMIPIWAQRMMVINDTHEGSTGQTTTLEGMESILNNLLKSPIKYDLIIIDYYQNIGRSNKAPGLANWQVQEKFCTILDTFKNNYLAPVVVLSQLKEKKDVSFKERIEGRDTIMNVSTCAMEVFAERDYLRTGFKFHKSRFNEAVGKTINTGFDKGRYVPYTGDFIRQTEEKKIENEKQQILSNVFGGNPDENK